VSAALPKSIWNARHGASYGVRAAAVRDHSSAHSFAPRAAGRGSPRGGSHSRTPRAGTASERRWTGRILFATARGLRRPVPVRPQGLPCEEFWYGAFVTPVRAHSSVGRAADS
jgi:hypothetical protein